MYYTANGTEPRRRTMIIYKKETDDWLWESRRRRQGNVKHDLGFAGVVLIVVRKTNYGATV